MKFLVTQRLSLLILALFLVTIFPSQPIKTSAAFAVESSGFCDTFNSTSLNSGWQWVDPLGDSTYSMTANPGHLRMSAAKGGHDLYSNANAPRLLQAISGDFTVTTKVAISPLFNYQGAGLLMWQDENNYVRLERTLTSGIDLWYKVGGVYAGKEIILSTQDAIYLKLQRNGNDFVTWYSLDNTNWQSVLTVNFPVINTQIQMGLALINQWQDNPIYADFDSFILESCANTAYQSYLPVMAGTGVPPVAVLPISVPILAIAYYPPANSDPTYLDAAETGITDKSIADMQAYTQKMTDDGTSFISDATRYHGYKDANAPVYLHYFMQSKIEYLSPIPRGYPLAENSYLWDLAETMRGINICNRVDTMGIKEVWIYGYETPVMHPSESKMSSRYGDISNSHRDDGLPEIYRLPKCINSYVIYSFNYGRGIETNIHNRMHQIESVMGHLEPVLFWKDFSEDVTDGLQHTYRSSCGNTHFMPNWSNESADEYIYTLQNHHLSNCETWQPDDNLTTYIDLNCTRWGCTELGYYKWFMQNIPGRNNGIVYNGKQMRNWWEAMYDFNTFVDAGPGLLTP